MNFSMMKNYTKDRKAKTNIVIQAIIASFLAENSIPGAELTVLDSFIRNADDIHDVKLWIELTEETDEILPSVAKLLLLFDAAPLPP